MASARPAKPTVSIYISGVEVGGFSDIDPEFMRLRIPAQRYAVFAHRDHISTIRNTMRAIWSEPLKS